MTPCIRIVGGGQVCGPSLARCGSDKSPRTGTSIPANSLEVEGTDSYRALSPAAFPMGSVAPHTHVAEGQIDALRGVAASPVADGPRCV